MKASSIFDNGKQFVKTNNVEILTGFGVAGVLTTAYFAAKGGYESALMIRDNEPLESFDFESEPRKERFVRRAKLTWKNYIPATTVGALTVGAIIGSTKAGSHRTAAAVSAYSLTEAAFKEYREHVISEIGEKKEHDIRDKVAQTKIDRLGDGPIILGARGSDVLCCELYTGRYFKSDMETLRKTQNDINALVNNERFILLEEFYDMLDLPHTSMSDQVGWDSNRLLMLTFTTTLSPHGEPCLAFDYNYVKPL